MCVSYALHGEGASRAWEWVRSGRDGSSRQGSIRGWAAAVCTGLSDVHSHGSVRAERVASSRHPALALLPSLHGLACLSSRHPRLCVPQPRLACLEHVHSTRSRAVLDPCLAPFTQAAAPVVDWSATTPTGYLACCTAQLVGAAPTHLLAPCASLLAATSACTVRLLSHPKAWPLGP